MSADWVAAILILAFIGFCGFLLIRSGLMVARLYRGESIIELMVNTTNRFVAKTVILLVAVAATIFGIIQLTSAGFFDSSPPAPQDPAKVAELHKFSALGVCERQVEKRLKAPSTAKFAVMSNYDEDVQVSGNDAAGYLVKSYVDSQNSFGTMLRAHFACTASFSGGNADTTNWRVELTSFDE